ncbi:MAG: hypothetical protein HY286_10640 [Planctomycetes bacterium]|nr:hypothetical protein [Planctomycetota bacterium]
MVSTLNIFARKVAFATAVIVSLAMITLSGDVGAQAGPKAGQPKDNTPKPGIFLKGAMRWGRIVDIWVLDDFGSPTPIFNKKGFQDPFYMDMVVGESVGVSKTLTTTVDPAVYYQLYTDPVSGANLLILGTQYSKSKTSPFQRALAEAESTLGTIAIGNATALPPFSVVPRDAAIVLNFDRAVNPKSIGPDSIRFYVGNATSQGQLPPAPFEGRYLWKAERPKTVVFDPSISAIDDFRIGQAVALYNLAPSKNLGLNPQILPLTAGGFPASISSANFNVAVFMPAQYNIIAGVTKILLGSDGTAIDTNKSSTKFNFTGAGTSGDGILGVARVFRSGSGAEPNKGFLADPTVPQLMGTQAVKVLVVASAVSLPAPPDSRLVTLKFVNTACDFSVHVGDTIQQGNTYAQIASINSATLTDADPSYQVVVDYLQTDVFNTNDASAITTPYTPGLSNFSGCFLIIQPSPTGWGLDGSVSGVNPQATITARFSKPINVSDVNSMRNMALLTNAALPTPATASHSEIVIGNSIPSPDQKTLRFVSYLPFPHTQGTVESLKFVIIGGTGGIADLVGNGVDFGGVPFSSVIKLDTNALSNTSRNFNMKFDSLNEGAGPALQINGEINKVSATEVSGRPSTHFSRDADTSNVMVAAMVPPAAAISTPLNALGARMQTLYRNVDVGLVIDSIQDINIEVESMDWAPFAGHLNVSDFFKHVRIDLAHSEFYPDETFNPVSGQQVYPNSGLSEQSFAANIFDSANHTSTIVYEGPMSLNQNLLFTTGSGTVMIPIPKFTKTFTWRDATYGSKIFAGPAGGGANPQQWFLLTGAPTPTPAPPGQNLPWVGTVTLPGSIPSLGLPLLVDFRVYPADDANTKGLNGFVVYNALLAPTKPNFSVWSEGGLDANQSPKTVTPDVAPDGLVPTGSFFPPGSTAGTPGTKTTPGDGRFYVGRLDFGVKKSYAFTHFFDLVGTSTTTSPTFLTTNTILLPFTHPSGTSVSVAFRGATAVTGSALTDARCFDAYGDLYTANANVAQIPQPSVTGCGTSQITTMEPVAGPINFTPNLPTLNGKRYLQMRFEFVSDIINNVSPTMNAFGVAYANPQ